MTSAAAVVSQIPPAHQSHMATIVSEVEQMVLLFDLAVQCDISRMPGLHYYNVLTDQMDFKENLKLLGESLALEATQKHILDLCIGSTTGALIGAATAATGGLFATAATGGLFAAGYFLSDLAAATVGGTGAVLGDAAQNESDAASDRSISRIMQTIIDEGADDSESADPTISEQGEYSDPPSSLN